MKILVIGSGGREHALVWKIKQSPLVSQIFCAPGNPGIAELATNVPIPVTELNTLLAYAKKYSIDLTVVGPEGPLCAGIVDMFEAAGLKIFGPSAKAALLEGSKAYAKNLMEEYGIPTAQYEVFQRGELDEAIEYINKRMNTPIVIKADGLAAGKGVIIAETKSDARRIVTEILEGNTFGEAGVKVVIEEFLVGEEASFLAFTDGKNIIPLASAQDHKPVFDDDKGPNTGGMGAYSPAPVVTPAMHNMIMKKVMCPIVNGLATEGSPYRGVIYAGVMIHEGRVKTLEFNVRFGDPECQPLMMRMKTDIVPILLAVAEGDISQCSVEWLNDAAVTVVMATRGYPGAPFIGDKIWGLEDAAKKKGIFVFHSGTGMKDNNLVTAGGRVLGVTALGSDIETTIINAYSAIGRICFAGMHYRKDIGKKALLR